MNLQLFALKPLTMVSLKDGGGSPKEEEKKPNTSSGYNPNSIVDYLKQQGQDSSYSARKQLAGQMGIEGYKGTAEQNTQLLDMLKNGSKPSTPVTNVVDNPSATPSVADPVVTTPAVSKPASTASAVTAPASGINGVSKETMQALNTPFSASSAYLEAMNYTNSLLEKLSSGRTSYTDQIKDMMNKIQNRDKFSYDVDTDMLFQQALASSMASGQQAMQDTMGQASALTGGYASTYAQSVGNQAYNSYIQDAYNNLPEYYQMALEAYNMEGQDMYNQLAMLSDADATEFGRLYDSWNANFTQAQNMYNQEYGAWKDNWNNNFNIATLGNSDYWNSVDNQYRYDAMANENYWNSVDNQYRYDSMYNSNEQNALDREHDKNESALDRFHDSFEAGLDREFENAWNEKEYLARYDLNDDGKVDEVDRVIANTDNDLGYTPLNARELESLSNVFRSALESGKTEEEAYKIAGEYLDETIGKPNPDTNEIDIVFAEIADEVAKNNWQIKKDTKNHFGGNDNNDVYTNGYETKTFKQLKEEIENSDMSEQEKAEAILKLRNMSTR